MFRVVMGLSRSSSREFEMPELPEVETVRRTLEPQLKGYKVVGVSVHEPRLRWRVDGARLRRCIIGQSVLGVTRRAKYLQIFFSGDVCLLVHLGMTGRLSVLRSEVTLEKHDHVIFHLEGGFELRFHDPRRFGSVDVCSISSWSRATRTRLWRRLSLHGQSTRAAAGQGVCHGCQACGGGRKYLRV